MFMTKIVPEETQAALDARDLGTTSFSTHLALH